MNETVSSRTSKWEITSAAVASALEALPDALQAGLMFFPQVPEGRETCFDGSLAVPVRPLDAEGRAAFNSALASEVPTGSTPTYDAYQYAEAELAPFRDAGPTAMVLVTDGLPAYGLGCTGDGPPATVEWDSLVTMVEGAARAGSSTLAVAAPASTVTHEMLTAVAHAGAPPGLCAQNVTVGCFYDLDVSLDLGPWLAEGIALASGCAP